MPAPWAGSPGEPALQAIQKRVLELAQGAGITAFPDVVLVDRPEELSGVLAGYGSVTAVPIGRGAVAGLAGPRGIRFATARTRLCAGGEVKP